MGVIQQIGLNQAFKIALIRLFLQECETVQGLQVQKGAVILVKPAVEGLQAVHQARRIVAEISLPVAEFKIVDTGAQGLFIQTLIRQLL